MERREITAESELRDVAESVMQRASTQKDANAASVVALYGDLGAGKTAMVKALALELGIVEDVTSPTFVILKNYLVPQDAQTAKQFARLAHIDAYRIEDKDELRPLHFSNLLEQKDTIVCIEWADRIEELLPPHTVRVRLEIVQEKRSITIE